MYNNCVHIALYSVLSKFFVQLLGLVKLSLHQFYLAFSDDSCTSLCLHAEVSEPLSNIHCTCIPLERCNGTLSQLLRQIVTYMYTCIYMTVKSSKTFLPHIQNVGTYVHVPVHVYTYLFMCTLFLSASSNCSGQLLSSSQSVHW